jgi:hypothetical protein
MEVDLSQNLEADLRFLAPIVKGEKIGVCSRSSVLKTTLSDDGLVVYPLLLHDIGKTIDLNHLIISEYDGGSSRDAAKLFGKMIAPGGWLIVGIHNAGSIRNIISRKKNQSQYHLHEFSSGLQQGGFDVRLCYGVFDRLPNPRFLVPVHSSGACQYFWNSIYVPASRPFAWMQIWFSFLSAVGFGRVFFSGFVLLAQRKPE